ncbi:MAG: acyl carrier protein [Actinobacteria bacterium]|nr:acyl carrier protein [Actinomycetota bacterium]
MSADTNAETVVRESMRNRLLETLRALWAEVLVVDSVDDEDNFFALGGDSLRAMNLAGRANAAGIGMPMSAVLRHPVLRDLAESCAERGSPS